MDNFSSLRLHFFPVYFSNSLFFLHFFHLVFSVWCSDDESEEKMSVFFVCGAGCGCSAHTQHGSIGEISKRHSTAKRKPAWKNIVITRNHHEMRAACLKTSRVKEIRYSDFPFILVFSWLWLLLFLCFWMPCEIHLQNRIKIFYQHFSHSAMRIGENICNVMSFAALAAAAAAWHDYSHVRTCTWKLIFIIIIIIIIASIV